MTWTINITADVREIDGLIDAAQPDPSEGHAYEEQQVKAGKAAAKKLAQLAARNDTDAVVTVAIVGHGDEADIGDHANTLAVSAWAPNNADGADKIAESIARASEAGIDVDVAATFDPHEDLPASDPDPS